MARHWQNAITSASTWVPIPDSDFLLNLPSGRYFLLNRDVQGSGNSSSATLSGHASSSTNQRRWYFSQTSGGNAVATEPVDREILTRAIQHQFLEYNAALGNRSGGGGRMEEPTPLQRSMAQNIEALMRLGFTAIAPEQAFNFIENEALRRVQLFIDMADSIPRPMPALTRDAPVEVEAMDTDMGGGNPVILIEAFIAEAEGRGNHAPTSGNITAPNEGHAMRELKVKLRRLEDEVPKEFMDALWRKYYNGIVRSMDDEDLDNIPLAIRLAFRRANLN